MTLVCMPCRLRVDPAKKKRPRCPRCARPLVEATDADLLELAAEMYDPVKAIVARASRQRKAEHSKPIPSRGPTG